MHFGVTRRPDCPRPQGNRQSSLFRTAPDALPRNGNGHAHKPDLASTRCRRCRTGRACPIRHRSDHCCWNQNSRTFNCPASPIGAPRPPRRQSSSGFTGFPVSAPISGPMTIGFSLAEAPGVLCGCHAGADAGEAGGQHDAGQDSRSGLAHDVSPFEVSGRLAAFAPCTHALHPLRRNVPDPFQRVFRIPPEPTTWPRWQPTSREGGSAAKRRPPALADHSPFVSYPRQWRLPLPSPVWRDVHTPPCAFSERRRVRGPRVWRAQQDRCACAGSSCTRWPPPAIARSSFYARR